MRATRRTSGTAAAAAFAAGGLALAVQIGTGSALAGVALLAGLCAAGGWLGARRLAGPAALAESAEVLERLAAGDLTARLDASEAAIGALAVPIAHVAERMERGRHRIDALADRLTRLPEQVRDAVREAELGAGDQEAAVEETASLLVHINGSIRGINAEIEGLARANEETAAAIEEMGTAIEQVATGAGALRETVESSTATIQQMGASIASVARSSDEVQQVAEETATATTQMDRTIQEVGEHVRGASELTRRVSDRAEEGSQAVRATIQGIQAIRTQTLAARQALEKLAGRVGEIGEIATVIGGISEETSLLSLNAAIIAFQAGEHGKAFAVVAGQIKTLSQRTNASAKQIEEMIRKVQADSANAVDAMGSGIDAVQEGVSRSNVAGEALEVIRSSAHDASGKVSEITRATEEQARNSKHVAAAAQKVSEFVQQISSAMGEQSSASESLARNVGTYLEMARQMAHATEEQRSSGRYIRNNSHSITEMIRSIQANTAAHAKASQQVSERFDALVENAHRTVQQIPQIALSLDQLRGELDDGSEGEPSSAAHNAAE